MCSNHWQAGAQATGKNISHGYFEDKSFFKLKMNVCCALPCRQVFEIQEELLPLPKVEIVHIRTGLIAVEWFLTHLPPSYLKLTHYVITLVGNEFSNSIKSDASYECIMESNGIQVPAVQHSWVTKCNSNMENRFLIEGILDTAIYQ